ncbi:MAG TPA: helix-turn-helix domain-containing protein [Modestobacter sp.]|nr:helix-turn-helix domain-containing protein [Modestobacter sp.]
MVHAVQVRTISNDEGNRLLRMVRRGTGSVVTWRRAQMVLLSAQRMPVATIAEVTFTSPDRVRDVLHEWAAANNVELADTPFYGSWLNRIEPQFTALRYFALDGTDHPAHREQARMIRRYIAWRNRHVTDPKLRKVVKRASTIKQAKVA